MDYVQNIHLLFIITLATLFLIVPFSIVINLLTLSIVGVLVYFLYVAYTHRQDREITALDVGSDLMTDPLVVGRAYFGEPTTGPIGDFVGLSGSDNDGLYTFSHKVS
ncbi:hypothetical protein [Dishui Lake phycodnavirus 4]|nr:hypothetical protein [Dishui Lake phycodnavirus 4]